MTGKGRGRKTSRLHEQEKPDEEALLHIIFNSRTEQLPDKPLNFNPTIEQLSEAKYDRTSVPGSSLSLQEAPLGENLEKILQLFVINIYLFCHKLSKQVF